MQRREFLAVAGATAFTLLSRSGRGAGAEAAGFASDWDRCPDRPWLGPTFWANPFENWRVHDGAAECTVAGPGRSVHLLTHELTPAPAEFLTRVRIEKRTGDRGAAGFEVGVHDSVNDHRGNCLFGRGVLAVVTADGRLRLGDATANLPVGAWEGGLFLSLHGGPATDGYTLTLTATDTAGKLLGEVTKRHDPARLIGNLALAHNPDAVPMAKQADAMFRFSDWSAAGEKFAVDRGRAFGPLLWSMYTVSDSRGPEGYVLKLTAVLPPLGETDARFVRLAIRRDGGWLDHGTGEIDPDSRTVTFRVPSWDADTAADFRLAYALADNRGGGEEHTRTGTVRAEPAGRPLVLGALTCQHDHGFPYAPVAANLAATDPDLLFFSGDQIYEGNGGFGIIRDPADAAIVNYLRKFHLFGWAFGEVMRDRPTLCLPDDHDVFQGNIWGEGGEAMRPDGNASTDGGYREPVRMVNAVHRANTSHHPDPFDPTPADRGMSVYYTDLVWGRVSFALIGDRQFKSAPRHVTTSPGRADLQELPDYNPATFDKPGLELLGERQEKFLAHWATDWRAADIKVLLTETVFADANTHSGAYDDRLYADLDSGGWPQTARNRAVHLARVCRPLHVNGDQHLTTMVQYGTDAPRDGMWAFCTPAISVGWPRWWRPDEEGMPHTDRPAHGLPNTGLYTDGFGHPLYVYAVGNPEGTRDPDRYRQAHIKASGFGIVRIDPAARAYVCESYRFLSEADGKPAQFPGWPVTVKQADNDGRTPVAHLPTLDIRGATNPVVIVRDAAGAVVSSLRITGTTVRLPVYAPGPYTVTVTADGRERTLKDLEPTKDGRTVVVDFS